MAVTAGETRFDPEIWSLTESPITRPGSRLGIALPLNLIALLAHAGNGLGSIAAGMAGSASPRDHQDWTVGARLARLLRTKYWRTNGLSSQAGFTVAQGTTRGWFCAQADLLDAVIERQRFFASACRSVETGDRPS